MGSESGHASVTYRGCCHSRDFASFFAEITFGIKEVLEPSGYDILLCHSRGCSERERSELNMLMGSGVDGLIVASEPPEKSPGPITTLREKEYRSC